MFGSSTGIGVEVGHERSSHVTMTAMLAFASFLRL